MFYHIYLHAFILLLLVLPFLSPLPQNAFYLLKFSLLLFILLFILFFSFNFFIFGLFGFICSLSFFHSNFNSYCFNFFISIFLSMISSPPHPVMV